MAKRVTIILPDETSEKLMEFSKQRAVSLSQIVTLSIEYYMWGISQVNDGYKIIAEKEEKGGKNVREIILK